MTKVYFHCDPFDKSAVTFALESGVDAVIVPAEYVKMVSGLARCEVISVEEMRFIPIKEKADEEEVLNAIKNNEKVALAMGWEVIPVENLLARSDSLIVMVENCEKAVLAKGILEKGVYGIVVPASGIGQLKQIVAQCRLSQVPESLIPARIINIRQCGLGHRVCLDTLTIMHKGQGMLVGNSSAFTFLVHAETEVNEYVASRPFRINAGSVHSYIRLPDDHVSYLGDLQPGRELLVVDASGDCFVSTLGRVKVEVRPMLQIEALTVDQWGNEARGTIFLQNAETIKLVSPQGEPISVVSLKNGDEILCRLDKAGRHFGMRISEDILEK